MKPMPAPVLDLLYIGPLPPYPGGSAISAALLLSGLARCGHRIRALAPLAETCRGDAFAARQSDVAVARFPVSGFAFDHTHPPHARARAAEWQNLRVYAEPLLRTRRPDVVLIGREPFAIPVVRLAAARGIPCVLRTAGGTTLELLSGRLDDTYSHQLLVAYAAADLIVSPAEHLAERLRARGLARVAAIPNAVDLQLFNPQPADQTLRRSLHIPAGAFVVLHASNLVDSKRPLDVVEAAAAARRQLPQLLLVIVGDGPWRQRLEAACEAHDMRAHVRFTGWVEYAHMPAHLNLADIVVMPADAETQARIYLETQACGRLLLASDIIGAREVITDGRTGLLFPAGDIDALARIMVAAAADPALRLRIGAEARRQVQRHDLGAAVDAYAAVLSQVRRDT